MNDGNTHRQACWGQTGNLYPFVGCQVVGAGPPLQLRRETLGYVNIFPEMDHLPVPQCIPTISQEMKSRCRGITSHAQCRLPGILPGEGIKVLACVPMYACHAGCQYFP